MKVKCKAIKLKDSDIINLKTEFNCNQDFHITLNNEYLVFGVHITKTGLCLIQHLTDFGHLVFTPLCLFDIIDARVSKYWEVKISDDSSITFWPPSFNRDFYHDNLFEEEKEYVEDFRKIKLKLEEEDRKNQENS